MFLSLVINYFRVGWDSPERVRVLIEGIQGVAHTLYLGHFTFTDTTPTDQPTCGLPCLPTNHLAESTLRQIAMLMKQYQDILQLASGSASQNSHESTDSGLQSSKEINKLLEGNICTTATTLKIILSNENSNNK